MTDPARGKHRVHVNARKPAPRAGTRTRPLNAAAATRKRTAIKSAVAKREISVRVRESAALSRENAALSRENAASVREDALFDRESVVNAAALMLQMREANEHLVVAAMTAQTAAETAERTNRVTEAFLAMLAHELRNPLAPIRNAVEILERIAPAHPQLPWIHDVIKRQADQMSRLLDDLLDVARVTSGKIVLQRNPVAVMEFLAQAIEASRPLIDARRQQLTLDIPPQSLYVDGDPARLTQVFSNLLNNASKYSQEGATIMLSVQVNARNAVMRVNDNGSGISAEALPLIFDLFMQSSRSLARAQGGLGIGLTVVRNLIEMHGGTIRAASAGLEKGSEFVVTLPLIDAPHDAEFRPNEQPALPPPAAGPAYRIVLIEDNVDGSAVVCALLGMMGHEVAAAYDGAEGVELVKSSRPQVVLCDIGLPKMDGYAVIARLRAELPAPHPIMIAMTGYGQAEDVARALEAGFDYHVVKPIDPDALLRLIAAHEVGAPGDSSVRSIKPPDS